METMITRCAKTDFNKILSDLSRFWGESRADLLRPLHHPMFVHEFGDTCFVAKKGEELIGYLFGFISQTEPTGYIHLTAVRVDSRRQGVGAQLHSLFVSKARAMGCKHIKAITTPNNRESIVFHQGMGMRLLGMAKGEQVPVVKDYSGAGEDRVVFWRDI
ncbi:MAG: GNAT family N-acetyltransferase [Planctomycetota bacterium]|jgi:GNAT superfamily N-acetyltransferase